VDEVRLAGKARLAFVRRGSKDVRPFDEVDVSIRAIGKRELD